MNDNIKRISYTYYHMFEFYITIHENPNDDCKYDASQNKLIKMRERQLVKNRNDQIETQMELYAKLTKGHTVFKLEMGYWLISNSENGGLAWHRARSNGEFYFKTNEFHFGFLSEKSYRPEK